MKKNLKETMLDNNGFSLVELIIVIAIMAVLVGILSPQYLKYVERSRESADLTTVDEIISAVQIYSADPNTETVTGKITCTSGKISSSDATVVAALGNAGITLSSEAMLKSQAYADWEITVNADGLAFSGTNGDDLKEALGMTDESSQVQPSSSVSPDET
jgi:type IV pilus assembly protein PilA